MLTKIVLKNFMNHVDSTLPVGQYTAITGQNDSGKSAVFHAIRWFLGAKSLSGDKVHYNFDNSLPCSVTLVEQSGGITYTCTKLRLEKETLFTMTVTENGETKNYRFNKSQTPEEIINVIGIRNRDFLGNSFELNFSHQMNAPFLLSESPSVGASVLAEFTSLANVDKALKLCRSDAGTYDRWLASAKNQHMKETSMLEEIGDLAEHEETVNRIKEEYVSLENADNILSELNLKASLLKTYTNEVAVLSKFDVEKISEKLVSDLDVTRAERHVKLVNFNLSLHKFRNEINLYASLKDYDNAVTEDLGRLDDLSKKTNTLTALSSFGLKLNELYEIKAVKTPEYTEHDLSGLSDKVELLNALSKCKEKMDASKSVIDVELPKLNEELLDIDFTVLEKLASLRRLFNRSKGELDTVENVIEDYNNCLVKVESDLEHIKQETKTCPVCDKVW